MATTIVTKSGSGAPTASDLVAGELAVDLTNKRLYTEDSGGTVLELGTNPSGDITFGDNGKAIFGAGSDLQIYHNATSNIIDSSAATLAIQAPQFVVQDDAGTKNLIWVTQPSSSVFDVRLSYDGSTKLATTATGIDVTGDITLGDSNPTITMNDSSVTNLQHLITSSSDRLIIAADNNDVSAGTKIELYVDGTERMVVTSTGIDVTGSVTADGLTVDGNPVINGTSPQLFLQTGASNTNWQIAAQENVANAFEISSGAADASAPDDTYTKRLVVQNTGDISFYEDTGTTPKFFWDASAEELTSNKTILTNSAGNNSAVITSTTGNLELRGSADDYYQLFLKDGGNVGIGCTPEDWDPVFDVLRIGKTGLLFSYDTAGDGMWLGSNAFYDDTLNDYKYISTDPASLYTQLNGTHSWSYAASGTANTQLTFSEAMRIDASGNLLVGRTSDSGLGKLNVEGGVDFTGGDVYLCRDSGNVLVGTTDTTPYNNNANSTADNGIVAGAGLFAAARYQGSVGLFNRTGSDGEILGFKRSGSAVGSIGVDNNDNFYIGASTSGHSGFYFGNGSAAPMAAGTRVDNTIDLGTSTYRFKDVYRSGSTISTSDRNMKQDERDLSEAEIRVAQACKGLLKAFRFIDAVQVDGDGARIHFGIIAQELQAAFETEGLDANKYAMFRQSTLTDDEGDEQVRLGVCYENLLAFIIAAI
jgi:hypothetical protein